MRKKIKKYRQRATVTAIKYDGNNIEEIESFISICNDWVMRDLMEGKIKVAPNAPVHFKVSQQLTLPNELKAILISIGPEDYHYHTDNELFIKEGYYIIFDTTIYTLFSLPEPLFIEKYEEEIDDEWFEQIREQLRWDS